MGVLPDAMLTLLIKAPPDTSLSGPAGRVSLEDFHCPVLAVERLCRDAQNAAELCGTLQDAAGRCGMM